MQACQRCSLISHSLTSLSQVLALPGASEKATADGKLMFKGPRVCMGIYRSQPTRIMPHANTGRADYFGPVVNFAARLCHAAAHGGQVVVPKQLLDELVSCNA